MQINGLHQAHAPASIDRPQTSAPANVSDPGADQISSSSDQLDLSPEAQALSQSQAAGSPAGEIRSEKVAAIRQAIADGVYETPEKMSMALDRMLDTFA